MNTNSKGNDTMNATRISEKDWVQWVHDFADIAIQEDTDLKFRMAMLKKAARERMADTMTEQQQELSEKITLAEALELVEFRRVNGKWVIQNVIGNVRGYVGGNVEGSVWGNVKGNVQGDVEGSVWGDVLNHKAKGGE